MGTSQLKKGTAERSTREQGGRFQRAQLWVGFFWQQLIRAFSIAGLIGYFASFVFVFRLPLPQRVWIYFLHLAFVLAAFLQPLMANAKIDNADWWTQMPYHTYTNLIFATVSGLGIGLLALKFSTTRAYVFWLVLALLVLPFFTFAGSEGASSQRNRWFGWMYGHDMLKDLPRGSVMIGGTDPGRFVPTYMIFGESTQPASNKRDPSFDRRDLYIITQNALGEPNYMKYLRDQYTAARPKRRKRLRTMAGPRQCVSGRSVDSSNGERDGGTGKTCLDQRSGRAAVPQGGPSSLVQFCDGCGRRIATSMSSSSRRAFPSHGPMTMPSRTGSIYRLNKTRLESLPKEVVDRDFAYWQEYSARLLGDPNFRKDFDAQRSFSKLRQTIANIYRHRKMSPEAERAYREALALWPGNAEAIVALTSYLWERGDFEEAIELCDKALVDDPNSIDLWRLRFYAERRKETEAEIRAAARNARLPTEKWARPCDD